MTLPADLEAVRAAGWRHVRETAGYLSEREARFLMLAAACAPARGDILEIGSFKGRSTVALAFVARHYASGKVLAVDPHTAPSTTDPDLHGQSTTFDDFRSNLSRAGVSDVVEAHRMYSRELAVDFARPLRMLWIDGDHTLEGARADIRLFLPRLVPGGILAMHDVLGTWAGSLRAFCEDVLDSDDFGPAGFCGSIGWAQFRPGEGLRYRAMRRRLAWPARRIIPIAERSTELRGMDVYRYKLWRAMAPHGEVDARHFVRLVGG